MVGEKLHEPFDRPICADREHLPRHHMSRRQHAFRGRRWLHAREGSNNGTARDPREAAQAVHRGSAQTRPARTYCARRGLGPRGSAALAAAHAYVRAQNAKRRRSEIARRRLRDASREAPQGVYISVVPNGTSCLVDPPKAKMRPSGSGITTPELEACGTLGGAIVKISPVLRYHRPRVVSPTR